MDTLIMSGNRWNILDIGNAEEYFGEHDRGYVQLNLAAAAPGVAVSAMEMAIRAAGVELDQITQLDNGKVLRIQFRKGIAPLLLIGIAMAAAAAIVVLMMGWRVYKMTGELNPSTVSWQIWVLIALGLVAVLTMVVLIARQGGGRMELSRRGVTAGVGGSR